MFNSSNHMSRLKCSAVKNASDSFISLLYWLLMVHHLNINCLTTWRAVGCHGVNINTEHRHREKKTGFTEWTENTTVYKPPLASQYHWLYTIPYEVANSIYCVFIAGVEFRRESASRLARDSRKIHVRQVHLGLVLEMLSVNLIGSSV